MGLQHVRAILPEEIDKFLNLAIIEKCRSIVISNASTAFQDSRTARDNPISPYNALRTLFREEIKTVSNTLTDEYYSWTSTTHKSEVLVYTSIGVKYSENPRVELLNLQRYIMCLMISVMLLLRLSHVVY